MKLLPAIRVAARAILDYLQRRPLAERVAWAANAGDLPALERLLANGEWSVNAPLSGPAPRTNTGHVLLHLAARAQSFEMVERLLALGATPEPRTSWGISPMHEAALKGNAPIVALLAAHGASEAYPFPSLSTYCEDDPYCPNSVQMLQTRDVEYTGGEHAAYRARRDGKVLEKSVAAAVAVRARL